MAPEPWSPGRDAVLEGADHTRVVELGRRLKESAEHIRRQSAAVRKLGTEEAWDSDAGGEMRKLADRTAGRLAQAAQRFEAASRALRAYAPKLEEASGRYRSARRRAGRAADDEARLEAQVRGTAGDDPGRAALERSLDEARRTRGSAERAMSTASGDVDDAARRAVEALERFADRDGLQDDAIDSFQNWVREHKDLIKAIADIAGYVALVAGLLAMLVFPIAALATLALLASAISLVGEAVLLAGGQGDWASLGLAFLGFATFGLGRVFALGARSGVQAARATATLTRGSSQFGQRATSVLRAAISNGARTGRTVPSPSAVPGIARQLGASFRSLGGNATRPTLRNLLRENGFSHRAAKDTSKELAATYDDVARGLSARPAELLDTVADSSRWLPKWGQVGRELRPDELAGPLRPDQLRSQWEGARFFRELNPLEPEAATALREARQLGAADDAVQPFLSQARQRAWASGGAVYTGITVDAIDKADSFTERDIFLDPLKDATRVGPADLDWRRPEVR